MISLLVFIAGLASGMFIEVKHDQYKDYKLEFLEKAVELGVPEGAYLQEDIYGQVWIIGPGSCTQVM